MYVAVRKVNVEIGVSISCSTLMSTTAPDSSARERRSQSVRTVAVIGELRRPDLGYEESALLEECAATLQISGADQSHAFRQ